MDASDSGVGAVLMQDGHPLAFFSNALGPKSRGLSTYEKEFMAILLAVQTWQSYLQFQSSLFSLTSAVCVSLVTNVCTPTGNSASSPNLLACSTVLYTGQVRKTELRMLYLDILLLLLSVLWLLLWCRRGPLLYRPVTLLILLPHPCSPNWLWILLLFPTIHCILAY